MAGNVGFSMDTSACRLQKLEIEPTIFGLKDNSSTSLATASITLLDYNLYSDKHHYSHKTKFQLHVSVVASYFRV